MHHIKQKFTYQQMLFRNRDKCQQHMYIVIIVEHYVHCQVFIYSPHVCLQAQRFIVDYFWSCKANPQNTRLLLFRSTRKWHTHNLWFNFLKILFPPYWLIYFFSSCSSFLRSFVCTCYLILLDSQIVLFIKSCCFIKPLFYKITPAGTVIISLLFSCQMCE